MSGWRILLALSCACVIAEAAETAPAAKTFFPPDPPDLPAVRLPDPLVRADGGRVATAAEWTAGRRAEVLELFRKNVFGRVPDTRFDLRTEVFEEDAKAIGGTATRRQVRFAVTRGGKTHSFRTVLFIPNAPTNPAPAFVLICNRGLENIDPLRVTKSEFWPVEELVARGYATATFHTSEVDPDRKDGYAAGVRALLDDAPRKPDAWGALGAWAWAASRILDYLRTESRIAGDQVAIIGHSRGGKTALWAAAQDERFALACVNNSGCGGANVLRRRIAGRETVARITTTFPYWFCDTFKTFAGREDDLPADHHALIALVAPRAAYVASASEDLWADPRGEFLGAVNAEPVYRLFGKKGLGTADMPAIGEPLHGDGLAYHIRNGKHNLTLEDWRHYLDYADRLFGRAKGK